MKIVDEILKEVREQTFDKDKLQAFETKLGHIVGDMERQKADLIKEQAIFERDYANEHGDTPDTKLKRLWNGSESGLRLIEVKGDLRALSRELSSIKSRLYNLY